MPSHRRRVWVRRVLLGVLAAVALQQIWRHGRDYVFADKFAVVEPGRIYRGAWQKPWPMRRLIQNHDLKAIVALAHPSDHPLAVREQTMAEAMGVRWVHIPIADFRGSGFADAPSVSDLLEQAANAVADSANHPVYFHCHHGINRASMVQIAYRTLHCGWTLDEAVAEIDRTFGLKEANRGPDYRHMERFYRERVLPRRQARNPSHDQDPRTEASPTHTAVPVGDFDTTRRR